MSGKRAKALKEQARAKGRDGSVVIGREYNRLKKLYVHPTYAPVVVENPTSPGTEINKKRKQPIAVAKKLLGK